MQYSYFTTLYKLVHTCMCHLKSRKNDVYEVETYFLKYVALHHS